MIQEQIEQAANRYAENNPNDEHQSSVAGFIAGAESRQPEIDELVEVLRKIKEEPC